MLEQLEDLMLTVEQEKKMSEKEIGEIFRIMHTIKGSSAMMMYNGISEMSHAVEDVFFIIRADGDEGVDYEELCDIVLASSDYIKNQVSKIEAGENIEEPDEVLLCRIKNMVDVLKDGNEEVTPKKEPVNQKFYITSANDKKGKPEQKYVIKVNFEKGCQMENIRAFSIVHNLKPLCTELLHRPKDIINDTNSSDWIFQNGFDLYIQTTETKEDVCHSLEEAIFVEDYSIDETTDYSMAIGDLIEVEEVVVETVEAVARSEDIINTVTANKSVKQNMISVNLNKLDSLMNLVGEIVITESMVTQNPDLDGLLLDNFNKSVRQLRKLTDELQDIVMDIRMVPVSGMFHKMRRIVRDMSKSLRKEVDLVLVGEETELDKSVLDMLSDPMMHLIRNSMDHGIEEPNERIESGKNSKGKLKLEARNSGSDVVITIVDDGKGIDKMAVLAKAEEKGLLTKTKEEMTDKEINSLILLPGFSTKQEVSEFSGRGVGMDVVKQNIEKVGGIISVVSEMGIGTTMEIKIPLTLAIIDGMEVSVGRSRFTVPTISIKESFRPETKDIVCDPSGNEMMMIRGNCYPIVRLHEFFKTKSKTTIFQEGIIVVVENEKETFCLFVDELLGEQQVVVKPLPAYVNKFVGDGCTIMGNGKMSLILDVGGF
jgi:two-component system chemotaxis sensor kinase CheA